MEQAFPVFYWVSMMKKFKLEISKYGGHLRLKISEWVVWRYYYCTNFSSYPYRKTFNDFLIFSNKCFSTKPIMKTMLFVFDSLAKRPYNHIPNKILKTK